jgi:GH24 family phage-related lysozyme (muramidase)
MVMSQYMAWPTADGVWHIGTGLTLPPGASLADLNKLLTLRHIDRAQIGFHRPNDEALFNAQFASAIDQGRL